VRYFSLYLAFPSGGKRGKEKKKKERRKAQNPYFRSLAHAMKKKKGTNPGRGGLGNSDCCNGPPVLL